MDLTDSESIAGLSLTLLLRIGNPSTSLILDLPLRVLDAHLFCLLDSAGSEMGLLLHDLSPFSEEYLAAFFCITLVLSLGDLHAKATTQSILLIHC